MQKTAVYISELNLPSSSAYSIHVMKMFDALKAKNFLVNLYVISLNKNDIFEQYKIENKFLITPIDKKKKTFNFIDRVIFTLKILFQLKKKPDLIISRSIIASLILSLFNIKNILEMHHDPKGLSAIIFNFLKYFHIKKYLKIILLHPNILNKINLKKFDYLILDDAVNIEDFKAVEQSPERQSSNFLYIGSFYHGKCLEIIEKVAFKRPNLIFDLYGSEKTLSKKKIDYPKNINFLGSVYYSEIPKILKKYKFVLMPYQKNVKVRSKNLDVGLNMSPLKMFDYLAAGKLIVASKLDVYNHILQNNFNSILIESDDIEKWVHTLSELNQNSEKYEFLKNNAIDTSKIFTWKKRVDSIVEFSS